MDQNTENTIINALGDIHVTLDEMRSSINEMKDAFNLFGERVVTKLDSIDLQLKENLNLKKEIEKNKSDIEAIKKHLKIA